MNSRKTRSIGLMLAIIASVSAAPAQPVKLRVPTVDSVLARFAQSGFVRGSVYVEGTFVTLSGASVTLSDQPADTTTDTTEFVAHNRSDSTGSFNFDLVPEGQYYLDVEYPGYFPSTTSVWIESQQLLTTDIELIPDYSHPSLHRTGSVQFEIRDKSTGMPIDDATIYFREPRKYAGTNSSGASFVHLLSPGRYHLEITADGYSRQLQTVTVASGACTPVTIELRERNVSLDDLLCHEGHHKPYPVSPADPATFCTITGKVIDVNAKGYLTNEQVYLAPFGIVTNTDSTGTFVFRGLRPGIYCLTAAIPGYGRETEHGISLTAGRSVTMNVFLHQLPSAADE